jgi:hypothetical protein
MPWHDPTILRDGGCRTTPWRGYDNAMIIKYIIRL